MEMLLVNPRKRRKKAKGQKRRSSRRRRRARGRRAAPKGARAAAGYVVGSAPIRRRKLNPRRRRRSRGRSRRRRNPAISLRRFAPGNVMDQVMGALPGAVGALGLDVALGFLPIPVTWKAGVPGYITKIAGAIGLGMLAGTFVGSATAAKATTGALTVMFHGILRELVATNLPGVPLGMYLQPGFAGLGYAGSGYNPMNGLGLYLPDISSDDMGMDQRDLGSYLDSGNGNYY